MGVSKTDKGRYFHYSNRLRRAYQAGELTEDQIRQLKEAGFPFRPKTAARAVICIETGEVFESASAASARHGVGRGAVGAVCSGKLVTAAGLHWRYLDEYDPDDRDDILARKGSCVREVIRIEDERVYETATAASRAAGVDSGSMTRACQGKLKRAGGFHWRYLDEYDASQREEILAEYRPREVICVETEKYYPSAASAEADTSVSAGYILRVCQLGRGTAGGLHWLYANEYDSSDRLDILHYSPYKSVVCVETGVVYPSCAAASRALNGRREGAQGIAKACRGEFSAAYGYHWRFESDFVPSRRDEILAEYRPREVICVETGWVFESAKAASEYLRAEKGVVSAHVLQCCEGKGKTTGGFHWRYLDEFDPGERESIVKDVSSHFKRVVCYETGIEYGTVKEATAAVGLRSEIVIRKALRDPSKTAAGFHWYLADEVEPTEDDMRRRNPNARAVVCWETGEVFESVSAVAEKIGRSEKAVADAIRRKGSSGGYHWYYADQPRPNKAEFVGRNARAVVCWETRDSFESMAEAGAWAGIPNPCGISQAIKNKRRCGGYHWYYADQERPDESEFVKTFEPSNTRKVVCWETGETFESLKKAAEWAGVRSCSISKSLKEGCQGGGYHWYYADQPRPERLKEARIKAVVCVETGEVFKTASDASAFLGFNLGAVSNCLKKGRGTCGVFHWLYATAEEAASAD